MTRSLIALALAALTAGCAGPQIDPTGTFGCATASTLTGRATTMYVRAEYQGTITAGPDCSVSIQVDKRPSP